MGRHPVTLTDPLSLDPLSLAWLDWMAAARIPAHTVARRRAVLRSIGNAGTAMRPLAATLALLSATQGGRFELRGVARMHERPIGDLVGALRRIGCLIDELGTPGYPPLLVHGGQLHLQAPIRVRGDVSSQFLTGVLMALPLTGMETTVEVVGELISRLYVEITLAMMARVGGL